MANDAPTFVGPDIPDISVTKGSDSARPIAGRFTSSDTLAYSKSPAGATWPAWLSTFPTTGTLGAHNTGSGTVGTTTGLKVRATDTAGQFADSNAFSATLTPTPAPPTFTGPDIGNITATVGAAITPVATAGKFSSTDTLIYNKVGTWPAGLALDQYTGVISGTMSVAATATGLKVRGFDSASQFADSNVFSVTVMAGTAPVFNGPDIADITVIAGRAITPVDVSGTFSSDGTPEYSASPAGASWPSGLSIHATTGVISGTPAASATGIKVRKANGTDPAADSNAFNVTVSAAPPSNRRRVIAALLAGSFAN